MPQRSFGSVKVFYPPHTRDELIAKLRDGVVDVCNVLPLRRAALFGSWAHHRATAFSDIDILIVYEGPERDDAYRIVRNTIRLRGLEPHVYTASQAEKMNSTLDRMTRGGVELL